MKAAVIVFPGSNCDRDVKVALEKVTGGSVSMVWHADAAVPATDLIVLPGGFAYGDYLRTGAMAAHSPIMRDVAAKAKAGTPVLGICNGFQVLCEAGLLPGVLMRNASLKFVCRDVLLKVERTDTLFTQPLRAGRGGSHPHRSRRRQLLCRRSDAGSRWKARDASCSATSTPRAMPPPKPIPTARSAISPASAMRGRRVLGMMPHPERLFEPMLGGSDGRKVFESILESIAA